MQTQQNSKTGLNKVQQHNSSDTSMLEINNQRTRNIEATARSAEIRKALNEAILTMAHTEDALRRSTITIATSYQINHQSIVSTIEGEWEQHFAPLIWWNDKKNVHVKFTDEDSKALFLNLIQTTDDSPINRDLSLLIVKPNLYNQHFSRKPIRLVVKYAKLNINLKDILTRIKAFESNLGIKFTEPHEGKVTSNHTRTLSFKTNSAGFDLLFDNGLFDGSLFLPHKKTRVFFKINVKPWKCNYCFRMGMNHQCAGKLCPNCGSKEHKAKNCNEIVKFCTNCKKRGHRARDAHCPKSLNAAIKELQRCDIPLKYYANSALRNIIISNLIIH